MRRAIPPHPPPPLPRSYCFRPPAPRCRALPARARRPSTPRPLARAAAAPSHSHWGRSTPRQWAAAAIVRARAPPPRSRRSVSAPPSPRRAAHATVGGCGQSPSAAASEWRSTSLPSRQPTQGDRRANVPQNATPTPHPRSRGEGQRPRPPQSLPRLLMEEPRAAAHGWLVDDAVSCPDARASARSERARKRRGTWLWWRRVVAGGALAGGAKRAEGGGAELYRFRHLRRRRGRRSCDSHALQRTS